MNSHLFYCRCFQSFYYFFVSRKINIILADRSEVWTSIFLVVLVKCIILNLTLKYRNRGIKGSKNKMHNDIRYELHFLTFNICLACAKFTLFSYGHRTVNAVDPLQS